MKIIYLHLILIITLGFSEVSSAQEPVLTNQDVIALTKAGLEKSIIIAKISTSVTKFDVSVDALIRLKQDGVADEVVTAMISPKPTKDADNLAKPKKIRDELGSLFPTLKNSVVTVWSELGGRGSGFIVDPQGLIVTNFHVVGPSETASIQFNEDLKVAAKILVADPKRDVAILWANLAAFPEARSASLFDSKNNDLLEEGERVIAIGSPLHQRKIMTTGVISKIEARALISDVNINHGNSGGPLFNSLGEVIGITTFGDFTSQGGPGISGIVRIEEALPLIEDGRKLIAGAPLPSARLLPVEPKAEFPIDAIKEIASAKKFDLDPYIFTVGKFNVTLYTPTLKYRIATEDERVAMQGRKSRDDKSVIKGNFKPFSEFASWGEYVGEYMPVLHIRAMPQISETMGSLFGRALVGGLTGVTAIAGNYKFKADFYRMRLFCNGEEVEPIQQSRIPHLFNNSSSLVRIQDATYEGLYTYPANAISAQCKSLILEIYSAQDPGRPAEEIIKAKHILKLASDFKPYFDAKAASKP
jgi:S1-C subfamily serine protease